MTHNLDEGTNLKLILGGAATAGCRPWLLRSDGRCCCGLCRGDITDEDALAATEDFAEVNGARLWYQIAGVGPNLLMAHGLLIDSGQWDSQVAEFAREVALRHPLRVLERRVGKPAWQPGARLVLAAPSRLLPRSAWSALLPRPETLLRGQSERVRTRTRPAMKRTSR